jgi:hypothetical protein
VNELAEIMTVGDQEYEEIIEEYEEEILVPEENQEPLTDFADTPPAQGKAPVHNLYFFIFTIYVCVCVVHLRYRNFMKPTCIYVSPMSLTSIGSHSFFA